MNLYDSLKDKEDEDKSKKYKMFSVFYVYSMNGDFCAPFAIDFRTNEVVNIKSGEKVKVPSRDPQNIYDALRFLHGFTYETVLHYESSIKMVEKRTKGNEIFGKVFKGIRKEIDRYTTILDRPEILRAGEFKNTYASYNDLIPLTAQLQAQIKKEFLEETDDSYLTL